MDAMQKIEAPVGGAAIIAKAQKDWNDAQPEHNRWENLTERSRLLLVAKAASRAPVAVGVEPVKLDYSVLHAFAEAHRISYNQLCSAVHGSLSGAGGEVGAQSVPLGGGERNALRRDHPLADGECSHGLRMSTHCPACATQPLQPQDAKDAKDAERYRWLRDSRNWREDGLCPIVANGEDTIYGEHLDKSIDDAIAASGKGGME